MRLSTATSYASSVGTLQRRQEELSQAQEQMTSGKRISQASDDPAGIARAERAMVEVSRGKALMRTVETSRTVMTQAETALGDAVGLTQTAREALVAAGNGSYTFAERKALVVQLQQLRGQLLTVANQKDGGGNHLFGGQGATTAPFLDLVGGVDWWQQGGAVQTGYSDGQINGSLTENVPLTIDGLQTWLRAPTGNGTFATSAGAANQGEAWIDDGSATDSAAYKALGQDFSLAFSTNAGKLQYTITGNGTPAASYGPTDYVAGKAITDVPGASFTISGTPDPSDTFTLKASTTDLSVFDALDKAIAVLGDESSNNGQVMQSVQSGLLDLDRVLGNFEASRAVVGETLNQLDGLGDRTGARILGAQTERSNIEDLDMVQAVSEFTNKQTSYQAALQSYTMVQKLSLFNYIGN
ncbi:flagellar hook-associated protein 3 FlgL [Sphaerotilus hippei]|uniref:Flagellar hook-associated protein 3 FlgL n=1 Tax=Sphaerotilus hippei TaxID=744406 RepID=A0A318GVX1_9BURK|nr:flagellar hook-associated protein FlgL [Sphaerotilus hippei]PXW93711.1 flagellar hook-associated protein 3 FlgL [Sphaerotilus hippei]